MASQLPILFLQQAKNWQNIGFFDHFWGPRQTLLVPGFWLISLQFTTVDRAVTGAEPRAWNR